MSAIGDKEKLTVLLAEYSALRAETNARISSSYVILGAISLVITWLSLRPVSVSWGIVLSIGLIGFVYCARVLTFDTLNAARRVRELEREINHRVGETLLVWESERGGLTSRYWRALFLLPPKTGARDPGVLPPP